MSKKSGGLLAAITVIAAGAAALFLSKKENRQIAKVELAKAATQAKRVSRKLKQSKTAKIIETEATKIANQVVIEAKKMAIPEAKKATKRVRKMGRATKTVKRPTNA